MTWAVLIQQIFEVCIIPLLGLLTAYIISFIKAKNKVFQAEIDNELYKKYMNMLENTITKCVVATNQTYTDALKKSGNFDMEHQKQAFQLTYNAVLAILTEEAKEYLENAVGDLNVYITKQIEAIVNENKKDLKIENRKVKNYGADT